MSRRNLTAVPRTAELRIEGLSVNRQIAIELRQLKRELEQERMAAVRVRGKEN